MPLAISTWSAKTATVPFVADTFDLSRLREVANEIPRLLTSADNLVFKQKLLENFNSVVFENDLKWAAWEGDWGPNLGWGHAETALDWLDSNNLATRGHYAAWAALSGVDGFGPDNSSNDTSQIRDPLFAHITDKLATVGTRVTEWDVVNDPVGWGPDTYEEVLGTDIHVDINDARSAASAGMLTQA